MNDYRVELYFENGKMDNKHYDLVLEDSGDSDSFVNEMKMFYEMLEHDRMSHEENKRYIEKEYCMVEMNNYILDVLESAEY